MTGLVKKITGEIKLGRRYSPEKTQNVPQLAKTISQVLGRNPSEFLETLFLGSLDLAVSDIHFEAAEENAKIRLRLDGLLQDLTTISQAEYRALLSRLKLASGIKLNISDRPQDGRFSIIDQDQAMEVRASTLPAEYGESLVLRILNPQSLMNIEELGLREDLREIFLKEIGRPNGMIIVTGPTGSGKTTTLYAFLKRVQKPEIKIITIEDPIEYHLAGISQTQVDSAKGYSFASGLRAIVRQDPDVILVGEIRDQETAQIALQAALTGHLVFTTLHTNDAAGSISRLTDLKTLPTTIASALNLVIAQRLVRKVCQKCALFQEISAPLLEKISRSLSHLPKEIRPPAVNQKTKIPLARGCEDCNFSGYRGRLGVFEALRVDEEMERFILEKPPSSSLREKAIAKGMTTMRQDGLLRVLEGVTTTEEVERVIGPLG